MKHTIPALAATALLVGCAMETPLPAPAVQPVAASVAAPACTRGAIDSNRSFILCPAAMASEADAMQAMAQSMDLSLDIGTLAARYGVSRQSLTGIEAATYAKIVGKTPEQKPRDPQSKAETIVIDGKEFRRIALEAEGREPTVLFVES